ncbi:YihY/virulence factor BrkB family protein [Bacillus piscicola]|uniref:YihY/virulence factor BrkB family protein n=1 Tax=Bacillus piscicola TaxID=1632684 RepID=UPI001F092AB1|nr:YihY/virulence factor BrkB family protein [Bacillus piscicola]
MSFWELYGTAKAFIKDIIDDRITGLAAEQAFFYMLSLFPMIILFLAVLPYFSMDIDRLMQFIDTLLPQETADMVQENVFSIVSETNRGLLTFGIIGTLWSASSGVNAFIRAMNQAFDVEEPRPFWKTRSLSILLTIGLMASFIVIFALSIFGELILHTISRYIFLPGALQDVLQMMRWIVTVLVMISILSVLYFLAPYKKLTYRYVLPGAVAAMLMWLAVSYGFSFYVTNFSNYSSTYGSLGGVIALMLWLFLTGLALVIGGEINAHIHKKRITHR